MRLADAFGILIANTDRHYGNLSLYRPTAPGDPFRLAPLYDMTPMAYAPQRDELRQGAFVLPEILPGLDTTEQHRVTRLAWAFWDRCAHSPFVSPTFQALAADHARELHDRHAPQDDAPPPERPSAPRA
ncbi:MAG: HipA domain-containing protein [Acidiferrobacter sp.]